MVPAEALLKSRSPHALEDLINGANLNETRFIDFTSVWQKMQIEHDARGDFDRLTPSDNPWRARVFDAGTTQVPLRQVVLEVSAHGGASRRYLIFKQDSSSYSGWLVLGNIDILGGRYEGSPHQQYHRVITTSGHTWLLLRAVASGTGTYDVKEMWYEIRGPRPEKALEYSIEGWHASGDVSDRKFSSRLISEESSRSSFTVKIMFSVRYGENGSARSRFSKNQRATYVWNSDLAAFVLDESRSSLTTREIEEVYSPGCLSQSEFFEYNSVEPG